jgi:hypothetical protein
MCSLAELLSDDPAWPLIQSWVVEASHEVVVLPTERTRGEATLHRLQVTTGSVLGAIALETGGLLIDHGWLRLLGAGSTELHGSLMNWNKIGDTSDVELPGHALIVGYDAIGGFFAINGGEFEGERGQVFYFAPNTLECESLERGYSDFVYWTLTGDVDRFYAELRWSGWRDELAGTSPDLGFALYPPPFAKDGRPLANVSRRLVPMRELWVVQQQYVHRLANVRTGAPIEFKVEE